MYVPVQRALQLLQSTTSVTRTYMRTQLWRQLHNTGKRKQESGLTFH
jgi:hypothetical protein